jgi:hypothetical protein
MTTQRIVPKEGMKEVEQPIFAAASWLTENGYSRMKVPCSGSGGSYHCDDVVVFKAGEGPVGDDYSDHAGLQRAVVSLATWDWGAESGGEATLEIYDDGRYSITGGRRSDDIIEEAPVFGSVSATPATVESGKLPLRDFAFVGRIPEEENVTVIVTAATKEQATQEFIDELYSNEPEGERARVLKVHGTEAFIDAIFCGENIAVVGASQ